VLGCGLDDRGFESWHRVHTGTGTNIAFYPMGTGCSFLGVKLPGCEANNSPSSSAEVKNVWSYTSTPQYAFIACSVKKNRGKILPLLLYLFYHTISSEKLFLLKLIKNIKN
jgi:hypothetical protein